MASRNLLEGILTVRRIDFLTSSGDRDGARATVIDDLVEPETTRRGRDILAAEGGLDWEVREARERRVRRSGMLDE